MTRTIYHAACATCGLSFFATTVRDDDDLEAAADVVAALTGETANRAHEQRSGHAIELVVEVEGT